MVARWYEARGYDGRLARNWRDGRAVSSTWWCPAGGSMVFCEVKSRSSNTFGVPAEAVTVSKQARLRRVAGLWLSADGRSWTDVRFDVASVVRGQVAEVIESAF